MPSKNRDFEYTGQERDQIAAAYAAAAGLARETHESLEGELLAALQLERKDRNSLLVARATVIEGFLDGFGRDPHASELAGYSPGVRAAVILGAFIKLRARQSGRADGTAYDKVVRLCRIAISAHTRMLDRGLAKTAARTVGIKNPEE